MIDFDDWYADECAIDAAEMVGPNSHEYSGLVDRYIEDDTRRDAARVRYLAANSGTTTD